MKLSTVFYLNKKAKPKFLRIFSNCLTYISINLVFSLYAFQVFGQNRDLDDTIVTFNVVVHVLNLGEKIGDGSNIPDNLIEDGINYLSEYYRGLKEENSLDINVEFKLADEDPNGNKTNGINRINILHDFSHFSDYEENGIFKSGGIIFNTFDRELLTKEVSWNKYEYLNIYTTHRIDGKSVDNSNPTLGFTEMIGEANEGIYLLHQMLNEGFQTNTRGYIKNYFALKHEVGHYLGLLHTFQGGEEESCPLNNNPYIDGDGVSETQPHKYLKSQCLDHNECVDLPFDDNTLYNLMNYINFYCNEVVKQILTNEQKNKIMATLFTNNRIPIFEAKFAEPKGEKREFKGETNRQFKRLVSEDRRCEASFKRGVFPEEFQIRYYGEESYFPQIIWTTNWVNHEGEDDNYLAWGRNGQFKIFTTQGGQPIDKWLGGNRDSRFRNGVVRLLNNGTFTAPDCELQVFSYEANDILWRHTDGGALRNIQKEELGELEMVKKDVSELEVGNCTFKYKEGFKLIGYGEQKNIAKNSDVLSYERKGVPVFYISQKGKGIITIIKDDDTQFNIWKSDNSNRDEDDEFALIIEDDRDKEKCDLYIVNKSDNNEKIWSYSNNSNDIVCYNNSLNQKKLHTNQKLIKHNQISRNDNQLKYLINDRMAVILNDNYLKVIKLDVDGCYEVNNPEIINNYKVNQKKM